MRRTAVFRDLRLECAHVLAQDEVLARADTFDGREHFGAELRVLRLKIE